MQAASWRSEARTTLALAAPLIVAQVSSMGMNVVDSVIAGRISAEALGGVAVGAAIYSFALLICIGTLAAVSPTVAQLFGARRFDEIVPRVRQAYYVAAALGLLVMLICWNGHHLVAAIGVEASLRGHADRFLDGIGWGGPGLAFFFALRNFADGMGRTQPGMYVAFGGLLLLIPLAIAMGLGFGPIPALGTYGLGLATALVLWLQALTLLAYLARASYFRRFGNLLRIDRLDPEPVRALLALGLPIAFAWMMEGGLFITVALLMGRIGADWAAAHQIAVNVASVAFMIPLGLAQAVTVRVGQARGAGDAPGVRRAGVVGLCLALGTQVSSATIMLLGAASFSALYAPDSPHLVPLVVHLMGLAAIFQISDGLQVVAGGALRGLKETRLPMLITAFAYWGVGFPLAYTLGFAWNMGGPGLWIGFIAGLSVAALLLMWRFFTLSRRLLDGVG